MRESVFQARLIKKLERMFPDAMVLKNDANYRQGIPDLLILIGNSWAALETKREYARPGTDDFEPNQEWYLEEMDQMSFAACIYPENEREVLHALQQAFGTSRTSRVPKS